VQFSTIEGNGYAALKQLSPVDLALIFVSVGFLETRASSYLNNSMNSVDHNSHRSNSEDKGRGVLDVSGHVLPEINNVNVNHMNMTSNSDANK